MAVRKSGGEIDQEYVRNNILPRLGIARETRIHQTKDAFIVDTDNNGSDLGDIKVFKKLSHAGEPVVKVIATDKENALSLLWQGAAAEPVSNAADALAKHWDGLERDLGFGLSRTVYFFEGAPAAAAVGLGIEFWPGISALLKLKVVQGAFLALFGYSTIDGTIDGVRNFKTGNRTAGLKNFGGVMRDGAFAGLSVFALTRPLRAANESLSPVEMLEKACRRRGISTVRLARDGVRLNPSLEEQALVKSREMLRALGVAARASAEHSMQKLLGLIGRLPTGAVKDFVRPGFMNPEIPVRVIAVTVRQGLVDYEFQIRLDMGPEGLVSKISMFRLTLGEIRNLSLESAIELAAEHVEGFSEFAEEFLRFVQAAN